MVEKPIEDAEELCVTAVLNGLSVTLHVVPLGRPVSINVVTQAEFLVNVILVGEPLIGRLPEDGEGE